MKKILVIEDTTDVRELITACLTASGFQTVTAQDGLEGVEVARRHLPDLIVCDINMPRLDGYGTLRALRQDAVTAGIPFIFLTGVTDKVHMRQGMELGADDYLTKPFSLPELLSAVRARLKKQEELVKRSEQKLSDLRGSISLALPHELLTPLNGIIGFASILMQDSATLKPAEVQEFSTHIYSSATRLHRLIENFLIFAHLEMVSSDPQKLAALREADRLFARELVSQVVRQKATQAQREADLTLALEEVCVKISSEHFKKIAEEILDNAFKFSEPGTPVRVATGCRGRAAFVTVTNRGRGMTAEQITSVGAHLQFERKFYEQQGSGLGLTIAKRLTELHGGRLTITSTPGEETAVEAAFPRIETSLGEAL
jgi:signal transduction histidine kinase